jgi:hypothetical protein
MRGDGRNTWRVQVDRRVRDSNELFEWAHNAAQGSPDAVIYTGYLQGMQVAARAARTKPRLGIYGLGEAAASSAGGSTSRVGADLSIPITQTSSFIGTFHPDYSNVELDQQTISPTAFARRYNEVRPFFTQGSQFYNDLNCNDCFNYPVLYTPGIPTPREGYALEGKEGQYTYGSFDAIGDWRNDDAQSIQWRSEDRSDSLDFQRVAVDMPGVHDVAQYLQPVIGNAHNFSAYATFGDENGSLVTNAGEGRYREYGINLYTPKQGLYAAYHDIGSQYAPIDGFNQINDVHGPTVFATKEFDFSPASFVQSVIVSNDWGMLHDRAGIVNDAYEAPFVALQTRNQWFLGVSGGYGYVRFPGQPGGYNNQNGVSLTYGMNSSTPSGVSYNAGRFGAGYLHSTDLNASIKVARLGTLSAETFETSDDLGGAKPLTQWLERVSFGYQIGAGQSVALGWRRIIGTSPPFFSTPVFGDFTNLSAAYYRRWDGNELYFAFGDPSQLNTRHAVILKVIRYIGAEKGT